ncbi:MAG TPA: M28 family peptidase [Geobacteraceae bacterium]|nr:M28 family peptidase [Geobacteraceae bacterium]
MLSAIGELVAEVKMERLKEYVRKLEGLRHGTENHPMLEEKAEFIKEELESFGLRVENQPFLYRGRIYRNIVATLEGTGPGGERLLVGAHYDSPRGSPGADDNASGVAVLLEAARILGSRRPGKTVQFVAFTLEEPQTWNHSILRGSRHFVREARAAGAEYEAVLVLECVGYTDRKERSQLIPSLVGIPVPKTGDFLGIIANRPSRKLMEAFKECATRWVPGLKAIAYAAPLRGYLIPQTRFSDHSSFWNRGYPALMLTDTAMFRNPNYHTSRDTHDTLDYDFMSDVARCVVAFVGGG